MQIKIADILIDPTFNSRKNVNAINTRELATSLQAHGLLQPVIVRELRGNDKYKYELIAGFRRTTAAKFLEWENIEAVVKPPETGDYESFKINLIENIQRKDLTFQEEAFALQHFYDYGLTEEDAARELNKSRGWIQARFIMLKLPEEILAVIHEIEITQMEVRNLHTIQGRQGADACVEAFTKLYRAKKQGKSIDLTLYIRDAREKIDSIKVKNQRRGKAEMLEMSSHILRTVGENPVCRALAWAQGEITDEELHTTMKKFYPDYKTPLEKARCTS